MARRCSSVVRATRLAALALLLPAAGCINDRQEQQIGNRVADQVNAQVPLVRDAPLNRYVSELGQLIARHTARPDLPYHFYIVDTEQINAFALPGGHIYVNRGLIEQTRNVSELAAVLAHEIGHVAARHGARNVQRQMRTGSLVGIMYEMILGREPALLNQDALNLGGEIWTARNSRADETEADRLAVQYLIGTGVDPNGMVDLLARLVAQERNESPHHATVDWLSSHPTTNARLIATRRTIRNELPKRTAGDLARNNASYPGFLERIESLPPTLAGLPLPSLRPPRTR